MPTDDGFIPRVLLTKSFIDSHDRALGTVAMVLRDASMEVVLFEYEVADQIAAAAIDEDVDVIGISFMSGGQVDVTHRLVEALRDAGHENIPVIVGGTIRPFDVPALEQARVRAIFRGGETLAAIVEAFRRVAAESRADVLGPA